MPETVPVGRTEFKYVGFWMRVLASLIDTLILLVILVPLMIAIYGMSYFDPARALSGATAGAWDLVVQALLVVVGLLFWRFRGATPGKMAISARIVDAKTGGPVSTGRLVLRFFAYFVSCIPAGLGFVWIGIDRRKQGFHDKIAGTLVVYDKDKK